ncbi:MAG: helix-turn-helix transcriptional regulator [Theionarchaea archaeon]|nr:helix-turn-helix transcriptional regulator [Theionarchaea archaeon]
MTGEPHDRIEKELKVTTIDVDTVIEQLEVLQDPQRARIYFFILRENQATTEELMELTRIQRSTLSYHLTKMVETEILSVLVPATGRFRKIYTLPECDRLQLRVDFKDIFESNDVTMLKKYLHLVLLEYQFYATLAEISHEVIRDGDMKILSLTRNSRINIKLNNMKGFIPRVWKGYLTEKQAEYVETKLEPLLYEALTKYPSENEDKKEPKYNVLLGQYPLYWHI